jgi:outer membrane protein assembly factor BamA
MSGATEDTRTVLATEVTPITKKISVASVFSVAMLSVAMLSVPSVASAQAERITEIRVHGNHTTPDADILALAGLTTGSEASEARLRDAERRLRDTGRFEGVELRRRYLSIADPSQILVMIVVDEHPAISETDLTPGPVKKMTHASMWLPILTHTDGYGLTYGARVAWKDPLGDRSRVSVPLTWGGERRIGVEAERLFDGPISIVRGGVSLARRVNPHVGLPDTRREARIEAERIVTDWLRAGGGARLANVRFGDRYDARHTAGGVHAVFDTRIDPSFPRDAVHARLGWERLAFQTGRADRWMADVRGYAGIGGSRVLALRGQMARSRTALPPAEQSLLGGSDTLRGYRTGHRAGDNLAAATIEIRQPLNSPLSIGRFGVKAFVDAGATWAAGGRLGDQRFDRGIGAGVYMGAGPVIMDLDVAWPEQGNPRVHVGLGVSF